MILMYDADNINSFDVLLRIFAHALNSTMKNVFAGRL